MRKKTLIQVLHPLRVSRSFKSELQEACQKAGIPQSIFIRFSIGIAIEQLKEEQGKITELIKEWAKNHEESRGERVHYRSNATIICPICKCLGSMSISKCGGIAINHRNSDGFKPSVLHYVSKTKFPDFWIAHINDYREENKFEGGE